MVELKNIMDNIKAGQREKETLEQLFEYFYEQFEDATGCCRAETEAFWNHKIDIVELKGRIEKGEKYLRENPDDQAAVCLLKTLREDMEMHTNALNGLIDTIKIYMEAF